MNFPPPRPSSISSFPRPPPLPPPHPVPVPVPMPKPFPFPLKKSDTATLAIVFALGIILFFKFTNRPTGIRFIDVFLKIKSVVIEGEFTVQNLHDSGDAIWIHNTSGYDTSIFDYLSDDYMIEFVDMFEEENVFFTGEELQSNSDDTLRQVAFTSTSTGELLNDESYFEVGSTYDFVVYYNLFKSSY